MVDRIFVIEGGAVVESGSHAELASRNPAFAFTNPIYVDADADGRWTPPGLPVVSPTP